MPSEVVNQMTRLEWRDLGFYYDRDNTTREWRLTGSRNGLFRFRDLLLKYAADPRHAGKSEHEHYGPYQYLEIMTWPEAGMDDHAIHGALDDLRRLASLVDQELSHARAGVAIRIQRNSQPTLNTLSCWMCVRMTLTRPPLTPRSRRATANKRLKLTAPRFLR